MSLIQAYLPQDRIRALSRGETLPIRAHGSTLFADIHGFTRLTEVLREELGARRGAEELSNHLDIVYKKLIEIVEQFGGSVIYFAGDSITCWFDQEQGNSAKRATSTAFALQKAMEQFKEIKLPNKTKVSLTLKISIVSGPVSRFAIGDPDIFLLDIIGGATLDRIAICECLAKSGEVLLDQKTAEIVDSMVTVDEWRTAEELETKFAVVRSDKNLSSYSSSLEPIPVLDQNIIRRWIPQLLFKHEVSGSETFLAEFRPCVAFFVYFSGIDFDSAESVNQLDTFVRMVQRIVHVYDGTLFQVTIGDKGSYAYINFGALSAHENDALRAVRAAHQLQKKVKKLEFIEPLQIGVTQGIMRIGAYGGPTRRVYSAIGDDVNLAARLMQNASPGQILVSGNIHKQTFQEFNYVPHPPLPVKGKAEPLPVFTLTGLHRKRALRLQEPSYTLPMIGRQIELDAIIIRLDMTIHREGQLVGIEAEAGMGKSRLVAEVVRSALQKGFIGYGGICRSDGLNTPYLPWRSIFRAFFDINPDSSSSRQIRYLKGDLEELAPERLDALPLLSTVLGNEIPETELTESLDAEGRKKLLHTLLEDCLKSASEENPLLIVIEDMHWLDALSKELLEELALSLAMYPICFLLVYRPPEQTQLKALQLISLPNFTKFELEELDSQECEQVIRAKVAQLYPSVVGRLPPKLVDFLTTRSQGNPFYLEELLNFMRDRGIDLFDDEALTKVKLPDSLHSLILSRIDQLSEREKTTLRVASIIGRLFKAAWLPGYYPELGEMSVIKADLDHLDDLEITALDTPEPELAYIFKHIVTHGVTYESLPYAARSKLHEQLARYLEETYPQSTLLDTLAYHYGKSENNKKKREYFRRAGEAAQAAYANDAAVEYYNQLLNLLPDGEDKIEILIQRGQVLELTGLFDEAENDYRDALSYAQQAQVKAFIARSQVALGRLFRQRGEYKEAITWLEKAEAEWLDLNNQEGRGQALIEKGMAVWRIGEIKNALKTLEEAYELMVMLEDTQSIALVLNNLGNVLTDQGDYEAALEKYQESLALRREINDKPGIGISLNNFGRLAAYQGDYITARKFWEQSLKIKQAVGDKIGIAKQTNNLGVIAFEENDFNTARRFYLESLTIQQEIGDRYGITLSLLNLGNIAYSEGDFPAANARYGESLALSREIGDKHSTAQILNNLGTLCLDEGRVSDARPHYEESLKLRREIGDKRGIAEVLAGLAMVENKGGDADKAQIMLEESLDISRAIGSDVQTSYALLCLGLVTLEQAKKGATDKVFSARQLIEESLVLRIEIGNQKQVAESLIGLAGVELHKGEIYLAVQLSSAGVAFLKSLNSEMDSDIRGIYNQIIEIAQDSLIEEEIIAARESGQNLSIEQAIELALGKSTN